MWSYAGPELWPERRRQTHIDKAESVVAADECVELKSIIGRI